MTANMKPQGGRSIGPRRSAAYRAAPRQAKTIKQLKRKCRGGAGCRENISGFRLREKCFSLDIPFDRTSGLPVRTKPLGRRTLPRVSVRAYLRLKEEQPRRTITGLNAGSSALTSINNQAFRATPLFVML